MALEKVLEQNVELRLAVGHCQRNKLLSLAGAVHRWPWQKSVAQADEGRHQKCLLGPHTKPPLRVTEMPNSNSNRRHGRVTLRHEQNIPKSAEAYGEHKRTWV